ncbi:hypothetical protein OAP44_00950 [Candidatus Pelagibacter sp.]|nr:hypothetical protein [Candidatus Pelagibacter sp.]
MRFFFLDRFNFNFFFQRVKNLNKTNLAFIYNLNLDPITFDFGHFLIEAELFRKKKKLKKIDVYIVKNNKAVPARMLKFIERHSRNELKNRTYEIILPITRLLDSVGSTMILEHDLFLKKNLKKEYKFIFPENHNSLYLKPLQTKLINAKSQEYYPMFQPEKRSIEIVKKYLSGIKKKIVTITLRDNNYIKYRNSNLNEWIKFARYLKQNSYEVIFIPDGLNFSLKFKEKLKNFIIAEIVIWNLSLRSALYELSYINCCVDSGPFHICSFQNNKAKSLALIDFDNYEKNYRETLLKNFGKQDEYSYVTKNQKIVFKKDNFYNLKKEFENFVKKI